ncbi:hypothetical protein AGMMS49941_08970 [Deferribacterales bacterium]|nr:hypothetical protein AGMMS49941_08970 [Deferribacterales bacterium]
MTLASVGKVNTTSLGIDDIYVLDAKSAAKALSKIDMAIQSVLDKRTLIGGQLNRLAATIRTLNTTQQNTISAESQIRDLDFAEASADLAKKQLLMTTQTNLLSQTNALPQTIMQLIKF